MRQKELLDYRFAGGSDHVRLTFTGAIFGYKRCTIDAEYILASPGFSIAKAARHQIIFASLQHICLGVLPRDFMMPDLWCER